MKLMKLMKLVKFDLVKQLCYIFNNKIKNNFMKKLLKIAGI